MSGNVAFTDVYPDGPAAAAAAAGLGGPTENLKYPGLPIGASPFSYDYVATAAGTYDVWAPGSGYKFVLVSAFVTVSAAGRVALVDDVDIQGRRPVDGDFAANSGATPNLVPAPYVAKVAGGTLRLVTTVAGNTRVRVAGWVEPA